MEKKKNGKKKEKPDNELERKQREPDQCCGIDATAFIIFVVVGICILLIVIVILAVKLSQPASTSQADLDERTSSMRTKHMINPLHIKMK